MFQDASPERQNTSDTRPSIILASYFMRLRIPVINPANGQLISEVISATSEDIQRCVLKAQETFTSGIWSKAAPQFRSRVLTNLAHALEKRVPEIAEMETLQTGRAIREMKAQLARLPEWLSVD